MIIPEQINQITQKIKEFYKPELLILFGSYANGNPSGDSDLDFCLVKETNLPFHKRGVELRQLLSEFCVPFDFIIYTPQEFEKHKKEEMSFLNAVLKEGKVI